MLKMSFFTKITLCPDIGLKKYVQSQDLVETHSLFFFSRSSTTIRGRSPGGRTPPPPHPHLSTGECGKQRKTGKGESLHHRSCSIFRNSIRASVLFCRVTGDLKTFLLSRRNPKDECGEISDKKLTSMARDVACALSYLADQKFVHRWVYGLRK